MTQNVIGLVKLTWFC